MASVARIGMIGNGGFTDFLLRSWRGMPDVEVTSVAGRAEARLRETAALHGIPHVYAGENGWRTLLAEAPVDIVAVVTPPALHAEMAIAAVEAGKAVLCEKPLATTVADGEAVARAAAKRGVPVSVNYVMRYNPLFHAVKQVISEGVLGAAHRVDFTNLASDEGLPPDHWFWDIAHSGGILVEHGVHFFDIYTWLLGSAPMEVQGFRTLRPGAAQEDRVVATVLYESGALATFYHAFDRPSRLERQHALIAFDQGTLEIEGWIATSVRVDASVSDGQAARLLEILPPVGEVARTPYSAADRSARGGGHEYQFDSRVRYSSQFAENQEEMYARNVRDALVDITNAWRDPRHRLTADLDAALTSLRIATSV